MYRQHRHVVATVVLCLLGLSLAACGASATGSAGRAQATQSPASANASPATTAALNADVPATAALNADVPAATASPVAADDADENDGDESNPVAQRIADEFQVPVSEIEGYHDQDIGYGVLAQMYAIANGRCGGHSQYTVQQLVELHRNGTGMGDIRKQALGTAAARDCNLGGLKQQELDAADVNTQNQGQGQGKGKDK